jgi:hypothetical protein
MHWRLSAESRYAADLKSNFSNLPSQMKQRKFMP